MNFLKSNGIRSIAQNASYLASARFITQGMRFVYVLVLSRSLGPDDYGVFSFGQSWYLAFMPLALFGLGPLLIREVGRDRTRGAEVLARTLALRCALSASAAVVCLIAAWVFEADADTRWILAIFSLALAGRALANWSDRAFVAYEVSQWNLGQEALFRPIEIAGVLAVLATSGSLLDLAICHALVWWLQAIRGLYLVRRHLAPLRLTWHWDAMRKLLGEGLFLGLHNLFMAWTIQGPILLFRSIATPATLGEFALTMQALIALSSLSWALGAAALPVLTRSTDRGDGKDLRFIEAVIRIGFVLGSLASLFAAALGPHLVSFLFGDQYQLVGGLLGPALCMLIPIHITAAISPVLIARKNSRAAAACTMIGALVLFLFFPAMVRAYGAEGALASAAFGISASAIAMIVVLSRAGDFRIGLAIIRPTAMGLSAFASFWLVAAQPAWISLSVASLVLVLGAFVFGVITPEERRALRSAEQ